MIWFALITLMVVVGARLCLSRARRHAKVMESTVGVPAVAAREAGRQWLFASTCLNAVTLAFLILIAWLSFTEGSQ